MPTNVMLDAQWADLIKVELQGADDTARVRLFPRRIDHFRQSIAGFTSAIKLKTDNDGMSAS
jgi:hypothetical protein